MPEEPATKTFPEIPFEFGIFDWIETGDIPAAEIYEQRLRMLEYADEAGFFCYHLAEHHTTPLSLAPPPALFMAAAAQRTRRIHLGPLVYLLPLYNPLRLVQEVCMLDQMSGGRLELGVGRGVVPYELARYGVDAEDSREMFLEALDVLVQGMTDGVLSYEGKFFSFQDVQLFTRPLQRPYPPLWYATNNPESMPWMARNGMNTAHIFHPSSTARSHFDVFKREWLLHQEDPDRLNPHVKVPKIDSFVKTPRQAGARQG